MESHGGGFEAPGLRNGDCIVGKYIQLHDAYLSVVEALKHGGIAGHVSVKLRWVDSEDIEKQGCEGLLSGVHGILIPGGLAPEVRKGNSGRAVCQREQNPIPWYLSGHAGAV